jgi:DNA modification methylase
MTPYYEAGGVTIYHADCRDVLPGVEASVMVTDPPYGIAYDSGREGSLPRSIAGDADTSLRDWALSVWGDRAALVFGTWRRERPAATRMLLVWDTKGALGMGDLSLPWKPSHQEIYVLGTGFAGRRGSDVLVHAPVQSMAANGRVHPHEKPVRLMVDLISKCPPGVIVDPFMGSGSTLRAAKDLGRSAIGIEVDERYCEVAARRMAQEALAL